MKMNKIKDWCKEPSGLSNIGFIVVVTVVSVITIVVKVVIGEC